MCHFLVLFYKLYTTLISDNNRLNIIQPVCLEVVNGRPQSKYKVRKRLTPQQFRLY